MYQMSFTEVEEDEMKIRPVIQAVTITVSDLARSRTFYEDVLGFEPDIYHEPTRWQCYHGEGRAYLGIIEHPGYSVGKSRSIVNFDINEIDQYWLSVKDRAEVETPLGVTPWGSYKFVIRDPDGNRLGFVGQKSSV